MTIVNMWLKKIKLKFTESETKMFDINMNNGTVFKINIKIIENVENIKYLRFIVDKNNNFKNHVNYILLRKWKWCS